ncbi:MAG: nucleotide exchange factor GrpE, partial [Acidobacteria bacterium]
MPAPSGRGTSHPSSLFVAGTNMTDAAARAGRPDDDDQNGTTGQDSRPQDAGAGGDVPAGEDTETIAGQAVDETAEAVRRERDELRDRLLRQAAEFDNYRKRVERERRDLLQYAAADALEALLPVIDDFERAV